MKYSTRISIPSISRAVAAALCALALPSVVQALPPQAFLWDTDPVAAGFGGTGNWTTTAGADDNWTYSPTGTGPNFTWVNDSAAIFDGTPGIVSITGTGITATLLTFNTDGYTIAGPNALTLNSAGTAFNVTNPTDSATISAVLDGTGELKKSGDGTLTLTGANTYGNSASYYGTEVLAGTLTLTGAGAGIDHANKNMIVADATVNVLNGATVNLKLASVDGPTGAFFTVDGVGSTVTASSDFIVGDYGTGTLHLQNGGQISSKYGAIGAEIGDTGTATIDGTGSTWTSAVNFLVATYGNGTLYVQNGGQVSANHGFIGYYAEGIGVATVDGVGSMWANSSELIVGNLGTGVLNIQNGGVVSASTGIVGDASGGMGTVTVVGSSSMWTITNSLSVGNNGTGTLNIQNGGQVSNDGGVIGNFSGSMGTATVTGAGSMWTNNSDLYVGSSGTGTLNIQNGGQVSNAYGFIADQMGSMGTATVDGTGSTWTNSNTLTVGDFGTGTLNLLAGGTVASMGQSLIGNQLGSDGTVLVDGTNSKWTNTGNLSVGLRGTGHLTIQNGGEVVDNIAYLGDLAGSSGTAVVDGATSKWTNSGSLFVGNFSTGHLTVQNGGTVSSTNGFVGNQANVTGTATVTGAGSAWTMTAGLTVGRFGTGTLNIQNGGQVFNTSAFIGVNTEGTGTVTVDGAGSTWTNSAQLAVGFLGTGTLTIQNGGVVSNTVGVIGEFAGSTGTVTVDGAGSTWTNSGNLFVGGISSGSGGTGLLRILNGGVVSAQVTTIFSTGTVVVNGTLDTVDLMNSGALSGSGMITGNLANNGVLSPGNSPGTFTVLGNYTQSASGSLKIEIASAASFDRVVVGGAASLNGKLSILTLGGFVPAMTDKFTILTAAGGVNGTFSTVNQSMSTVVFDVTYLPTAVRLEFLATQFDEFFATLGQFTGFALTPNQKAVARAIDNSSGNLRQRELVEFLLSQNIDSLPRDFDRIAPEELTALFEITRANSEIHLGNIADQLALARSGARGFTSSLSVSDNDGKRTLDPKDGKSMPQVFAPTKDNNWGVWVSGSGEYVNVGDSNHVNGYDFQTGGVTLGLDYRVCSEFILGVAGSYAHTDTDLIENGDINVEAGRLALYGTWYKGGAYVNGIVGGGYSSYDSHRHGLDGFANGNTDGANFDASLAGGYDFKAGVLIFGPTASLAYTYSDISGFRENGSLAPLQINGQNDDSLRSRVGGHLQAAFKTGGVTLRPEIRAEWQHEYQDDTRSITAGFANGAGSDFTVTGPDLGRDSAILGAGLSVEWSKTITTYVNYEAEVGRANYDRQSVNLGLRLNF